jgi:DNA processing protein
MNITQKLRQVVALTLVPEMGPVAFKNGLTAFGSLEGLLGARISERRREKIFDAADREIEKAFSRKVSLVTFFDEEYPSELKEIYDPPILLYVQGHWPAPVHPKIAVVGSRQASLYGLRMAETIARDLAASGAVVVSGLAKGIDTAAHRGALSAKGLTLAVQGCGLSTVYPHENKKIAQEIVERGALVSEYSMDIAPKAGNFPVRNRIISGLSRAVFVAEAREKSGALITADLALEQGRDVYALPGQADSAKSQGSNHLLKQGARFITGAEDILQDYAMEFRKSKGVSRKKIAVTDEEKKMLRCLEGVEALHLDDLIEKSEFPAPKAIGLLSMLTLKGAVQELPGKYFIGKE